VSLSAFLYAISKRESGNYAAVNPDSGALGKYQVMPGNVPLWSKQALGHSITPDQFLASPRLQERIVRFKLGHYFREFGPAGAAAAWYSGDPNKAGDTSPQPGGYPSVSSYVSQVLGIAAHAMHLKPGQLTPHPPASTSTAGGDTGATVQTAGFHFPGGGWDPLNWIAGPIDSATGAIVTSVEKLATQSLIVLAGVGIIVVGAYEAFKREDSGDSGGGEGGLIAALPKGGGAPTSAASGGIAGAAEMAVV
jgi:hypothetical protein